MRVCSDIVLGTITENLSSLHIFIQVDMSLSTWIRSTSVTYRYFYQFCFRVCMGLSDMCIEHLNVIIKYLTYSLVKIVVVFEILQPFLPGTPVRFAMYMWYGYISCHNCDICVIVVTFNNTYKCLCGCSCRALCVFQFNP